MSSKNIASLLAFCAGLFLLWQLRWTFSFAEVGGSYFEYGSLHIYYAQAVLILLVTILWLGGAKFVPEYKWEFWWLAFIGWMLVSSLWSLDPARTLTMGVSWLLFWIVYVLLKKQDDAKQMLLYGVLCGLLVSVAVGTGELLLNRSIGLGILGEQPLDPELPGISVVEAGTRFLRPHGLTPHPNILGGEISILLWLALLVPGWVLAVLGAGLVFALSRSAWAGTLLGSVFLLRGTIRKQALIYLIGGITFGLAVILLWRPALLIERIDPENRLQQTSTSERLDSIQDALQVLPEHLWFGSGAGTSTQAVVRTFPGRAVYDYEPPHNVWLAELIEGGVVGVALMLLALGSFAVFVWRGRRWIAVAMLATLLAIGLVDHYLLSFFPGWALFWLIMLAGTSFVDTAGPRH